MKIASITLFCNERFRLEPWIQYFNEYGSDIYLQVIVNNGNLEDTELLKSSFPQAIVLFSTSRNMIASYNMAIKYILENTEADSILQVTNDLRIEKDGLKILHRLLFDRADLGLISPILLQKDSEIVENYGAEINPKNLDFKHMCNGLPYPEIPQGTELRTGLPGGCFLTKREVYETIGLQDERINMYADEVDMGIRCEKAGYKLMATSLVKSWHQHVFPSGHVVRSPMSSFYISRNHIYISRKYYRANVVMCTFWFRFKVAIMELQSCIRHNKGKERLVCSLYSLWGSFIGLIY